MSIIISTELRDLVIKSSPISGHVRMMSGEEVIFKLETVNGLIGLSEEIKRKSLFNGDHPKDILLTDQVIPIDEEFCGIFIYYMIFYSRALFYQKLSELSSVATKVYGYNHRSWDKFYADGVDQGSILKLINRLLTSSEGYRPIEIVVVFGEKEYRLILKHKAILSTTLRPGNSPLDFQVNFKNDGAPLVISKRIDKPRIAREIIRSIMPEIQELPRSIYLPRYNSTIPIAGLTIDRHSVSDWDKVFDLIKASQEDFGEYVKVYGLNTGRTVYPGDLSQAVWEVAKTDDLICISSVNPREPDLYLFLT